jgi:hypothetical protein
MGGFGLGWFIETFKGNGTTGGSIVGRWGLIGGEFDSSIGVFPGRVLMLNDP